MDCLILWSILLLLDLCNYSCIAIYREGVRILTLRTWDDLIVTINPVLDLVAFVRCYGQHDFCANSKLITTFEGFPICRASDRSMITAAV